MTLFNPILFFYFTVQMYLNSSYLNIKNYEKLENENKILSSESVYNKENYTEEELETIYSNVFDEETDIFMKNYKVLLQIFDVLIVDLKNSFLIMRGGKLFALGVV